MCLTLVQTYDFWWAQSCTHQNMSTARRVEGCLMSFMRRQLLFQCNAWSHVAAVIFKGSFWVIVMSSRRRQHYSCSQHDSQLSASTCRRWLRVYRVALSDGRHAVPPLGFLLNILCSCIMRWSKGLLWLKCILKRLFEYSHFYEL